MRSSHEVPDTGSTQIRVIGFGAAVVAAAASLEKHPAPGLLFRQYMPPEKTGGRQMSTGTAASSMGDFDSWLESAHILVLLAD